MPTRRIALFAWLATQLWAAAQVSHNGPVINNFGPNSQSGSNVFQRPPPIAPAPSATPNSAGTITTINGATGEIVPDPSSVAAVNTATAPAPIAGTTPTQPAPAIPTGPDFSSVPLSADPEQIDDTHILLPGDQFIYQVVEDQDGPKLLLVDENGLVKVPYLLEPIKAQNSTLRKVVQELESGLTDEKLGLYKKATIRVALFHSDQSRGHVMVTGAFMRSDQLIPVPSDHLLTLDDVIRAAGGFSPGADKKNVTIIHQTDPDKQTKISVDVADLYSRGKVPDMLIRPNDTVNVPSLNETNGYVIVSGEIRAQPALRILLPANEPMTVSQAIIDAGWTDFSKHTVFLNRWETGKDGKEALHKYPVDVDAVLLRDQKNEDRVLQPGDLVYVDWSIFASR